MSVELYEGAYGVTRGGEVAGPLRFLPMEPDDYWAWGVTFRRWSADGEDGDSPKCGQTAGDITHVFPTRAAAEAHLRAEKPAGLFAALTPEQQQAALAFVGSPDFGPAEPQPVTWPGGVIAMDFDGTRVCIEDGFVELIQADGLYGATTARQLAALLTAAADFIERNAE